MTVAKLVKPILAATLLALVTACSGSSAPDASASTTTTPGPAGTHRSANPQPVTAVMPDVIGGNAGSAAEQMSDTLDMAFKDASGQDRPVDHPVEWKICDSQPGPNQQITESSVIFDVVKISESCQDTAPQ